MFVASSPRKCPQGPCQAARTANQLQPGTSGSHRIDSMLGFAAESARRIRSARHTNFSRLLISAQAQEFNMVYASPGTDASTDPDIDKNIRMFEQGDFPTPLASYPTDKSKGKLGQKTLRRLAQNREAARKSRLRKKAYVQQLEDSRMKLTQLEQELQRARQQGIIISTSGDQQRSTSENEALAFNMEYMRWLEEHNKQINELRSAVHTHAGDDDLQSIVSNFMAHHEEIFRIKGLAAKADALHVLSATWRTPLERCFLWLGGFRPSDLLKLLADQLEPLTEQQLASICNQQQSSQEAEETLSQGMEIIQDSLAKTVASQLGRAGSSSSSPSNAADHTAAALGKIGAMESLLQQADDMRMQSLQKMQRVLTTRQSARALLLISDYFSRLRALNSLWIARPQQ
uniref:DOG1 domain-containing protein n=1 Tax=Oryza nivara TaxID=4536 RepID=A0A0E0HG87_ORYNI